jgi:uncharacterized protein YeaO (DUF488 family)
VPKSHDIKIKRIYDPPEEGDGYRVLVDRLWPRGVTKEHARIDHWARHLAPSNSLRKWFGHQPARFSEFRVRYLEELKTHGEAANQVRDQARDTTVTLLYAARDPSCNHAIILQEYLSQG